MNSAMRMVSMGTIGDMDHAMDLHGAGHDGMIACRNGAREGEW